MKIEPDYPSILASMSLDYLVASLATAAAGPLLGHHSADPEQALSDALAFQAEALGGAAAALELARRNPGQVSSWQSLAAPMAGLAVGLDTQAAALKLHPGKISDQLLAQNLDASAASLAAQLADFHQQLHQVHKSKATPVKDRLIGPDEDGRAEVAASHELLATIHELLAGLHHLVAAAYADGQLAGWESPTAKLCQHAALADIHQVVAQTTKRATSAYAMQWTEGAA